MKYIALIPLFLMLLFAACLPSSTAGDEIANEEADTIVRKIVLRKGCESNPDCENCEMGMKLFNRNCATCHKLNAMLVGPPLACMEQKHDRAWLRSFIRNSAAMIKAGDSAAVAIYEAYNKSLMTNFLDLTDEQIDAILCYAESQCFEDEE